MKHFAFIALGAVLGAGMWIVDGRDGKHMASLDFLMMLCAFSTYTEAHIYGWLNKEP